MGHIAAQWFNQNNSANQNLKTIILIINSDLGLRVGFGLQCSRKLFLIGGLKTRAKARGNF